MSIKKISFLLACFFLLTLSPFVSASALGNDGINDPDISWPDVLHKDVKLPKDLGSVGIRNVEFFKVDLNIPGLPYLKKFKTKIHRATSNLRDDEEEAITISYCLGGTPNVFILAGANASMKTLANEFYNAGYIKALATARIDYCALTADKSFSIAYMNENWTLDEIEEATSEAGEIFSIKSGCLVCETMNRIRNIPDIEDYRLIHFLGIENKMSEKQYLKAIENLNSLVLKKVLN